MLKVNELSVSYGTKKVLKNITFSITSDDILAVVGPSGSGKTTLIKALINLVPCSGIIEFDGNSINLSRQTVALVPQNYGLLPWKTVEQNIYLANKVKQHKKLNTEQKERIRQLMQELKIDDIANKFPNFISGGQAQRVALARAFSLDPNLLILDEAFSALDPVVKKKAKSLFLRQWAQNPTTTIMITHNLDEALSLSTKLFIIKNDGTGKFMDNPLNHKLSNSYSNDPNYYECLSSLQNEVNNIWGN